MYRNGIIAATIGALATFLPFWDWGQMGMQIVGAVGIGFTAFVMIVSTERKIQP